MDNLVGISALLAILHFSMAGLGAFHALTFKRDPRSALGWIFVCLTVPFAGPLIYFTLGVNRVRIRAKKLGRGAVIYGQERPNVELLSTKQGSILSSNFSHLQSISDSVVQRPLLPGNDVTVLYSGEAAYAAMLRAIDEAEFEIVLASYIFESNTTGRQFVDALGRAADRGVQVRVLIDGIGEFYSWPRITRVLRRRGVTAARFLPPKLIPPTFRINLRNHRKILVSDRRQAFTGGMNIGDRHVADDNGRRRIVDLHFRFTGPIVAQLADVFWEDWLFTTAEPRPEPLPVPAPSGALPCRVITDGPGEDLDKLSLILHAVIATARHSVWIVTPYFLPTRELLTAIQIAALRGATVNVLLPGENNLPYVHWASRNLLWELLQWDVNFYYQPPPFVHSKLLVVDDSYVQVGSANMDARSLRLNFEVAVEIIDADLAASLVADLERWRDASRRVTLEELDARSWLIRLRDSLAWLMSPYL